MTDLTRVVTTKDLKLIVAGRTIASLSELTISGESGLADVSVLSEDHKRWQRTKRSFSGSMDYRMEDMGAIGLVFGDYEIDPTKTEVINMSPNLASVDIKHIQGDKTNSQALTTGQKLALKFRAAGGTLSSASVYNSSGTDTSVTVSVQADNSGIPSGSALASGTIDCSGVGWKNVDLSSASLTMDDWYWIVIENCDDASFAYASTDIYTDWGWKIDTGTGWGTLNSNDMAFQLLFTDNTTYIHVELTDGTTTHTIKGTMATAKYSLTINPEDPLTGSLDFVAKELTFSEV